MRVSAARAIVEIQKIYGLLEGHFGDLKWWPARSRFEVIIGTVLTQNTAWKNVEKAILNLKREKLLDPERILSAPKKKVELCLTPSGYFRVKTDRVRNVCRFLIEEYNGFLEKAENEGIPSLREKLLAVNGVGPETADSMLLYAFSKPIFVVDAYTKRIFSRHGIIAKDAGYEEVQALVHKSFPPEVRLFNQFHALLVETGKNYCKKNKPDCGSCPLHRSTEIGINKIRGKKNERSG